MDVLNKQTITIDLRQTTTVPLPRFTQYDTNTIEFIIKDNGADADLNNVTEIVVNFKRKDNIVITRSLTAEGNVILYTLGTEEMLVKGYAELTLSFFNIGTRLTTKKLKIYIGDSLGPEFEGGEGIPLLQELFIEVASLVADTQDAANFALQKAAEADQAKETALETADELKLNWHTPVNTFADLATAYPLAEKGYTSMVRDTGKVYRHNGTEWQEIQDIDPTVINEVDTRLTQQLADKTSKAYVDQLAATLASGSPKGVYATVSALQQAFPNGNNNIYVVTGNVKEVASLSITAVPTTAGNITVTLNGVAVNIAVDPATDTTVSAVATKIRNTAYSGWITGGTDSIITFTATAAGTKSDATFSAGSTGATGTMSTTTQGVDADGKWYYWNGSAWTAGGVYQSTGIASGSVTQDKLSFMAVEGERGKNLFNKNDVSWGMIVGTGGELIPSADYSTSGFIKGTEGSVYVRSGASARLIFYDINKVYLSRISDLVEGTFTFPVNGHYVRVTLYTPSGFSGNVDKLQVELGTIPTAYEPFKITIPHLSVSADLIEKEYRDKLLADNIIGTKQIPTISNKQVTQTVHQRLLDSVNVRVDTYTYTDILITEVRTLNTGQSITLKHDLITFMTEVVE